MDHPQYDIPVPDSDDDVIQPIVLGKGTFGRVEQISETKAVKIYAPTDAKIECDIEKKVKEQLDNSTIIVRGIDLPAIYKNWHEDCKNGRFIMELYKQLNPNICETTLLTKLSKQTIEMFCCFFTNGLFNLDLKPHNMTLNNNNEIIFIDLGGICSDKIIYTETELKAENPDRYPYGTYPLYHIEKEYSDKMKDAVIPELQNEIFIYYCKLQSIFSLAFTLYEFIYMFLLCNKIINQISIYNLLQEYKLSNKSLLQVIGFFNHIFNDREKYRMMHKNTITLQQYKTIIDIPYRILSYLNHIINTVDIQKQKKLLDGLCAEFLTFADVLGKLLHPAQSGDYQQRYAENKRRYTALPLMTA